MSNGFLDGPKRAILILIVCLLVGSLGVAAQQTWGNRLSGDALGIVAIGSIVPLVAAIWSNRRQGEIKLAPVIYGAAGGAIQVLMMLVPTIATLIAYPNPKHPLYWTIGVGLLTTVISTVLGAIIGLVVLVLLMVFRVQPLVATPDEPETEMIEEEEVTSE